MLYKWCICRFWTQKLFTSFIFFTLVLPSTANWLVLPGTRMIHHMNNQVQSFGPYTEPKYASRILERTSMQHLENNVLHEEDMLPSVSCREGSLNAQCSYRRWFNPKNAQCFLQLGQITFIPQTNCTSVRTVSRPRPPFQQGLGPVVLVFTWVWFLYSQTLKRIAPRGENEPEFNSTELNKAGVKAP